MPKKRLTMRQIRELLRLKYGDSKQSDRAIALQLGVARSTIQDYLARVDKAGLTWPLPDDLSDDAIEQRLFGRPNTQAGLRRRVEPDWAALARELKRPGVTLQILWEEYRAVHPDGYGYSRFCELYGVFERKLSPTMRQHHASGDKVFVDYSGKKITVVDPTTGEVKTAELFIAVLGASNYTYAEATWSQKLPDWILDDWGPQVMTADHRRDLMEIVEDRYGRGSLLITSQVPVDRWHEIIGDPTLADAILDRIVHAAYRIDLNGESMRKRPDEHKLP